MKRPLCALLLACLSCSSGGGGGGGGGGDDVTRGVVTDLGSATVGGTDYDTEGAELDLDDAAEIALGMRLTVFGRRSGDVGTAERVVFDDELEGPIEDVDSVALDRLELTILDQTVMVRRGATVFDVDPALVGTAFDFGDLAEGQLVEVSGLRGGLGIEATRVELLAQGVAGTMPEVELKGLVAGLDVAGASSSFEIGDVTILFDATGMGGDTDLSRVPGMALANGDFVEVEGRLDDPVGLPDRVNAAVPGLGRIELEDRSVDGDAAAFEIEGIVSEFTDRFNDFLVDGQPVDAGGFNILFVPGDPCLTDPFACFLGNGVRVEVDGELVDGVLLAEQVRLRDDDVRVTAEIADVADVDPDMGTIELLGAVQVEVDSATRFDGAVGLGDLGTQSCVRARGVTVDGVIRASVIEDLGVAPCGDVELFGRVEQFDVPGGSFRVLGLDIPTDVAQTLLPGFPDDPVLDAEEDFYAFLTSNPNARLLVVDFDVDATTLDLADQVTRESRARVAAEIADDLDVDAGMGTIDLLGGVQVEVTAATELAGFADLGDLGMGDFVEVAGVFASGALSAEIVRREAASDVVELRGRVEDFDEPAGTFTLLGLDVPTDGDTEFEGLPGVGDEDEFYDFLLANAFSLPLLDVQDEDGVATTLDVADEVELAEE